MLLLDIKGAFAEKGRHPKKEKVKALPPLHSLLIASKYGLKRRRR